MEDRARREAGDPATPLGRLHEIAQERPDLRHVLAGNPSTYPALLEWLGRLGDPQVNAALHARAESMATVELSSVPGPQPEPGDPAAEVAETRVAEPVREEPTAAEPVPEEPAAAVGDEPTAEAPATTPGPAPTDPDAAGRPTTQPSPSEAAWLESLHRAESDVAAEQGRGTDATTVLPRAQPPAIPPAAAAPAAAASTAGGLGDATFAPATPGTGVGAVTATADPTGRRPMWAVLGLVAVLLVAGLIWVLSLRGDEDPGPAPAADPTAGETGDDASSPASTPEETGTTDVAAAQEAVVALPESTGCADPAADAAVVTDFAAAAAPDGQWQDAEQEGVVVTALGGLGQACGPGYAVEVSQTLADQPAAAAALADPARWLVPARPAPGDAQQLDAFVMPSQNIACTLGADTAACSIIERDFGSPPGCSDGAPVTVVVGDTEDARIDCAAPQAQAAAVLPYGASAAGGAFACTSNQQGVECWSTITGKGFTLARAGAQPF